MSLTMGLVHITVRGKFMPDGVATGTTDLSVRGSQSFGACQRSYPWSALALAAGARVCAQHIGPPHQTAEGGPIGAEAVETEIVATGLSCKHAYKAMDAGRFHATGRGTLGAFRTAGWTCKEGSQDSSSGVSQGYSCRRTKGKRKGKGKAPATFSFVQTGDPCDLEESSSKPGPQCAAPSAAGSERRFS